MWTPVLLAFLLLIVFLFGNITAPGPCFWFCETHAGHDFFTGRAFLGQPAAAGTEQPLRAETGAHLLRTLFSLTHLILTIILEGAIFSCILRVERLTTPGLSEVT